MDVTALVARKGLDWVGSHSATTKGCRSSHSPSSRGESSGKVGSSFFPMPGHISRPHAGNLNDIRKWPPQLNKPLGLVPTSSGRPLDKRTPRRVRISRRAHLLFVKIASLLYRNSLHISQARDHGDAAGLRHSQDVHEVLFSFILARGEPLQPHLRYPVELTSSVVGERDRRRCMVRCSPRSLQTKSNRKGCLHFRSLRCPLWTCDPSHGSTT
jgi:hypothetical protein